MLKGLFFSLPSVSVSKTLTPVIQEIASSGFEIIYYNTADFLPEEDYNFRCRTYPAGFKGYYSDKIDAGTSYFDFGNILIDAATGIMDFLLDEIRKEAPDFILHSHLAVWGKLIAGFAKLPAVTLYTTFVLDKSIMFSFHRQHAALNTSDPPPINEALLFYRKSNALYKKLQLNRKPDLWDVYINKGDLNLSFILDPFQPQRSSFGKEFHFLGYPVCFEKQRQHKRLIYVAMGTIVNKDISFYRLVIDLLIRLGIESIIAVGTTIDISQFGQLPVHIKIVGFTDQRAVLKESKLFITRGGMASVHEAVYSGTPMIVIPVIPEQQITATRIAELGIGLHLSTEEISEQSLGKAIEEVLQNHAYVKNLEKLRQEIPDISPGQQAAALIQNLLL